MKPSRYARKMMYAAGTAGTVTLEAGDQVTLIIAQSNLATGKAVIFGGNDIPIVGTALARTPFNTGVMPPETRFEATAAAKTIVFTDTVSFFVAFLRLRPAVPV